MKSLGTSIVTLLLFAAISMSGFAQTASDGVDTAGSMDSEFDVDSDIDITVDEVLADFDFVWETINDGYVDAGFGGSDWEALKETYRSRVESSQDAVEAYQNLAELVGQLGNPLTYIVPPWLRPQVTASDEETSEVELEYAGVGVLLQQMQSGEVWIIQVFRDTPAESAGVLIGDVIAGVNDWRVVEDDAAVSEISKRVRGPVGTEVTLTLRAPDGSERDVDITRAHIDLTPSVEFRVVQNSVGYLRIPALTEDLVAEASKALPRLLSMRYLILDLRNVEYGSVDAMTQVAQWFLGSAQIGGFVTREGAVQLPFRQDSIAAFQRPLGILINSGTYGVGELLAQILRDYKRGPLIGNVTRGGFHASNIVNLPSGGAMEMTIGLFITPANALLPIDGLTPDNMVELPDLEVVRNGRDVYIEKAVEVVRSNPRL